MTQMKITSNDFAIKTCGLLGTCWRFKIPRSSNLFCFSVTFAGACPKNIIVVYITFPTWYLTIFVCRRGLWSKSYEVHRELPNVHSWAFPKPQVAGHPFNTVFMGVQNSTESISFDLRSKSCRMRRPTHSKVYPAVSRIETSQNTSN